MGSVGYEFPLWGWKEKIDGRDDFVLEKKNPEIRTAGPPPRF
jgi:hypothetical protein